MKKLVFILMLLALGVLLPRAQLALNNAPFAALLGQRSAASAGYFLIENFEGPGYENVWTISSTGAGSLDDTYATAPAPLEASYSLRLNLSANTRRITNNLPSSYSTIYGYFQVSVQNIPASGAKPLVTLLDNGQQVFAINFFDNGGDYAFNLSDTNSTLYCCVSSPTAVVGVTNHIWFSVITGSGLDAAYTLTYSTNSTKPASPGYSTGAGRAVGTMNQIQIGTTNSSSWRVIFDKIRLSTTEIGSNPL